MLLMKLECLLHYSHRLLLLTKKPFSISKVQLSGKQKRYLIDVFISLIMEFADDGDVYKRIEESQANKVYLKEKTVWKILI